MKLKNICIAFVYLCCFTSCKDYLDVKPDKSQVVPTSLEDCQLLMNNVNLLGSGFPLVGEISTTDFYLTSELYNAQPITDREPYIWKPDANIIFSAWSGPYQKILVANQVLSTLSTIRPSDTEKAEWDRIKGTALLFRAVTYLHLTSLFTQPFDISKIDIDLGLPLKTTPNIDEEVSRGTLRQTYDKILSDLTESSQLLPKQLPFDPATRSIAKPTKSAALAALSRVYLIMGDYGQAFRYSDDCLKISDQLLDYNQINKNQNYSFARFNIEVLYELNGSSNLPGFRGLISDELYGLYEIGDLRRDLYFRRVSGTETFKFKGGYGSSGSFFCGYATNEMYLIRAESLVRLGKIQEGLLDLNKLRQKRWINNDLARPFTPVSTNDAAQALKLVLLERRKELPFTTLRWMDLRRLNKDSQTADTLYRSINGQEYTLLPNDLRYTLLIPREILLRSNYPQNPR